MIRILIVDDHPRCAPAQPPFCAPSRGSCRATRIDIPAPRIAH